MILHSFCLLFVYYLYIVALAKMLVAQNGLSCADVLLRNYSLAPSWCIILLLWCTATRFWL